MSKGNLIAAALFLGLIILLTLEFIDKKPVIDWSDPPSQLSSVDANENIPDTLVSLKPPDIKRFDWFDDIDAPTLKSDDEVSKLWQSEVRCCDDKKVVQKNNREYYKACYQSMAAHPQDRDLAAICLWTMDNAIEKRELRLKHNEYFIQEFFDYDRRTDNCYNCKPANISARIAMDLSYLYHFYDRDNDAITLLEKMNDQRKDEMSDWVIAEFSTWLAKLYLENDSGVDKLARIEANVLTLKQIKDNESLGWRFNKPGRFDKLEAAYLALKNKAKT